MWFLGGNLDVIDRDRDARRCGVVESQVFDAGQYLGGFLVSEGFVQFGRQVLQGSPVHQGVFESDPLGQYLVEDHAAQSGFQPFAVMIAHLPNVDGSVQVDEVRRMSDAGLVEVVESLAGALAFLPDLRQVEAAHHHIQGGRHQRLSGCGRQHIVCAEHEFFGF